MKLIVVTTCDNLNNERYLKLKASLERFGYTFECIFHPFTFGTQLNVIRRWAEGYTGDATHMLYTDAFDTLALGGPEEVMAKFGMLDLTKVEVLGINDPAGISYDLKIKMLISAEKNCYPHPERADRYPDPGTPWRFVNGGGWIAEIEYFKYLCGKENLNSGSHDQVWLMDAYLNNLEEIRLDSNCEIFQTIAFSYKEEWSQQERRFVNVALNTMPVFFHGNGHTQMDWVYEILQ